MVNNIYESEFHRRYVGGVGGMIMEEDINFMKPIILPEITEDEVLAEYRKYVGDPEAQLPEEVAKMFSYKRVENGKK
jgi:hypothetical protein